MQTDPATLPDDIATLKAMIIARDSALRDHAIEIEHLKLLIAKLRRQQYLRYVLSRTADHPIARID